MHTPLRTFSLSASALAVALLVSACGGGDAEPPPDTVPPTLAITDDVDAATADGPVTFTFTFSEDVGSSFVLEDVLVAGGTAGALTKVSDTVYTLTVTPPADSSGTLTVDVAAAKFRDVSNNDNTAAASGSQAFSTVVAPPPSGTVLADFDTVSPVVAGFEGAEGSAIEAGPAGGGSGNSFKVLRSGGQVYALGIIETTVPVAADRRTISAQVYSPTAGIPMVLKLEGPDGANSGDLQANETVVQGWQTLTWSFPGLDVSKTYNKIVLLPNLGTVDAPPGKAYYFDNLILAAAAGGGGGSAGPLVFSSGFAGGARTVEGGEFGGFSGSDLDGFGCNGAPENCGGGGDVSPAVAADDSYFFYYYQTPTPASALYAGIYVQAPGVTGGLSGTANTPGLQLAGQTQIKFNFNPNPEWYGTTTNNFMVQFDMGKLYTVSGNPCHIQLRKVVTPTSADSAAYALDLSTFAVVQNCGVSGLTAASVLATEPVSQVSFQAAGGGAAVGDGSMTTGANLSAANGAGVYPTTLVIKGAIRFE